MKYWTTAKTKQNTEEGNFLTQYTHHTTTSHRPLTTGWATTAAEPSADDAKELGTSAWARRNVEHFKILSQSSQTEYKWMSFCAGGEKISLSRSYIERIYKNIEKVTLKVGEPA